MQGNNNEKIITNKSKCRIALRRNAALLPVRPHYLGGRSGSYRQKCRFCALTKLHPPYRHYFIYLYIVMFLFLSGILSRGVGFDVSVCYIAFWRVHLNGDVFIDRFEWGEVCICTLCAVKYKGGVSNGMWDAKSDVMRKSKNAVKQRQWGQPRRQAKRGCDGVGYSAAMNPAEQWTPNGSNSQRGGLYRVKRRLHERSCRPGAAVRGEGNGRKTELVFAQPNGKREGARWREIR